jgi:hypothetical protein
MTDPSGDAKTVARPAGFDHLHLRALRTALDAHVAATATITEPATAVAEVHTGPSPEFHGTRDILGAARQPLAWRATASAAARISSGERR